MSKLILTVIIALIAIQPNFAQIKTYFSGYAVSAESNAPNVLYKYEPATQQWLEVGVTGGDSINIAVDGVSKTIYAVDGGTFGTIDKNTALFTAIGNIGKANGANGEFELDNIKGISYDPINLVMYAVHRINFERDLLFKIDVSTGKVVAGAMSDRDGNPTDYAVTPYMGGGYTGSIFRSDVSDIAYNPYTGELYVLHNGRDANVMISVLNTVNASIDGPIVLLEINHMVGLAFTHLGELYGTTADNGTNPNQVIHIDLENQEIESLGFIDPTGQNINFESLDFTVKYNDLALQVSLSKDSTTEFFRKGEDISYNITVTNQGEVTNTDIKLINYIPEDFFLKDVDWLFDSQPRSASRVIPGPLEPGESVTVPITLFTETPVTACSIINAAEISASYNPSFINFDTGDLIPILDFDSESDEVNNETNIIEDEINGAGVNAGEDEDDQDIATLLLQETNYSGCVQIPSDSYEYASIYDYANCGNIAGLENCSPITNFDNLSANEALWTVRKAAEYLSNKYNIEVPPVNIIVNNTKQGEINRAYFSPSNNVIVLGKGDGVTRTSMSAPDIVAHEYLHFLQHNLDAVFPNLENYRESGALRESFADIFGEIIEIYCYGGSPDWVFGSQVTINKAGIRSHKNPNDPNMDTQLPDYYLEDPWIEIDGRCDLIDRCGIHINCGVQNYWFYKLVYAFTDGGIYGMEKACEVIFDTYMNHLGESATYTNVAKGTMQVATELYGNNSSELSQVVEAWQEVGIFFNPIEWRLIVDSVKLRSNLDEIYFSLVIDSLGEDISADNLSITLNLDESYQQLTEKDIIINDPLTKDEVDIEIDNDEVTLNINRSAVANAQKRNASILRIPSNSSVFGVALCILSKDGGDRYCYQPVQVSGYTQVNPLQNISFDNDVLPIGVSCISPFDGAEEGNLLTMALDVTQQTCNELGAMEIEILDNIVEGVPPYDYELYKEALLKESITSGESIYLFGNLDEGHYTLNIQDANNGQATIEFEINFIGENGGSLCCPENLNIPSGNVNGNFNATNSLSFSNGTLITYGDFGICE